MTRVPSGMLCPPCLVAYEACPPTERCRRMIPWPGMPAAPPPPAGWFLPRLMFWPGNIMSGFLICGFRPSSCCRDIPWEAAMPLSVSPCLILYLAVGDSALPLTPGKFRWPRSCHHLHLRRPAHLWNRLLRAWGLPPCPSGWMMSVACRRPVADRYRGMQRSGVSFRRYRPYHCRWAGRAVCPVLVPTRYGRAGMIGRRYPPLPLERHRRYDRMVPRYRRCRDGCGQDAGADAAMRGIPHSISADPWEGWQNRPPGMWPGFGCSFSHLL